MKNKTEFENEKKQILESIFTDDFFEDIKKQIKNTDWDKLKKRSERKNQKRKKATKRDKKKKQTKFYMGYLMGL